MTEGDSHDLFNQFIGLSRSAFRAGYYEAAYHALTGALLIVERSGVEDQAHTVAQVAQEQSRWVNQHAPESRLSSRLAETSGSPDFYQMLIRQAHINRAVIRRNKPHTRRAYLSESDDDNS
jgi:hypothetical protein